MADDPNKDKEEIQSILSDLDSILGGMGGPAQPPAAPPPATPPPPAPKAPESEKAPEPAKAAEPPKPPVGAHQGADPGLKIELPPRAAVPPTPEKKPEPPKPAAPKASDAKPPLEISLSGGPEIPLAPKAAVPPPAPKPAEPPPAPKAAEPPKPVEPPPAPKPAAPPPAPVPAPAAPAPAAAPAAAAPSGAGAGGFEEPPADAPSGQIRRVALLYTASCAEAKQAFATFLSQSARTISKKPLFLRWVLSQEVDAKTTAAAVAEKCRAAKAVGVFALLEGWPPNKADELSELFTGAGVQFRVISAGDLQKKSVAVDIIVDMMLLAGEG